ncbi:MAG TPA: nicotinate-nucleotide--dimethylbenzimidazole phosphoribosyltransferase [Gemmatimonas sp.]|uniref:nicotinate-nucleotide--dimethylbenzimidazole phosphoribosyltransferase n=1 Tax=Gemmatimonas sp. TaxID=1962908 RepID=UPI002ED8859F
MSHDASSLAVTRLLLIRHGETAHNASGQCQGRLDVPMSARGEQQVLRLRSRLAASGALDAITAAYTSPLARAIRTSELLLHDAAQPANVDDDLVELSYGRWQGSSPLDWPPGADAQWRLDPWSLDFPDGESLAAVRTRAMQALSRIVQRHPGESVLVSAHGHFNRVVLLDALGMSPLDFWSLHQPNADAWWVSCTQGETGALQFLSAERAELAVTPEAAQRAIDGKTKPLGALGALEASAVRLAVLQQTLSPRIDQARICVFGADHGVAEEGVSAYPRAVTAEMMRNFARGGAAINVLARTNDAEVEVIDVGVDADLISLAAIRQDKVRHGSRNLLREPAMTDAEFAQALEAGASAVRRAVRAGVDVVGLGEMGIGNTTAAAAVLSALTGRAPEFTVGAGTGVQGAALAHKRDVVARALTLHGQRSTPLSARECLRRLGGLELAAMAGATLEAAHHPVVILVDGFISTVAVLAAASMAREEVAGPSAVMARLFLSHRSTETGHTMAIESLAALSGGELRPLLQLDMRLGEGSGAVLAVPLLRAAAAIMSDMATFAEAGVSAGDQADVHNSANTTTSASASASVTP